MARSTERAGVIELGESHAFVLRLRLDPRADGPAVVRLRLEEVEGNKVTHFKDIESAMRRLRLRLEEIVGRGRA